LISTAYNLKRSAIDIARHFLRSDMVGAIAGMPWFSFLGYLESRSSWAEIEDQLNISLTSVVAIPRGTTGPM
jgi:hypothetical protein